MYKTVSSRLTALFNPDGGHLNRYLQRKSVISKSFCEDLFLQDQILIPTQDYLTAAGLITIFGEKGFIELLERDRLKFIRTRGVFGYIRGTGPDGGLVTFKDPKNQRPQDSPIEQSVNSALNVIAGNIKERKKLQEIVVENSFSIDWTEILTAVGREAIQDLQQTSLWRSEYEFNKQDLLALPGMEKMQVRVIGPGHDPKRNVVDTLLALALYNSDIYLAEKYDCQDVSPFFSVGDLLDLKRARFEQASGISENLWMLLEVNGVPDFSQIEFREGSVMNDLLEISASSNAKDFRNWFHTNSHLSEKEILREYIGVLNSMPRIQSLPLKSLRFVVTTACGYVPVLGPVLSFFDTFIVDRLFRGASPKFFIDDLTKIKANVE
ncbi:MAG: hypothetical protein ACYC6O_00590 [Thermoleophilia bacterium]